MSFITEAELYPANDESQDPFYRDVVYQRWLGWGAGVVLALPTGDKIAFNLERDYGPGPVEPEVIGVLNGFRSHLARAAAMSARLQLERAQATTQVLAALGLAALVFNDQGKVLAANPLIEA